MNQKTIGIIVLILGVVVAGLFLYMKYNQDNLIRSIVQEQGTCFLDDGTCLHDEKDWSMYAIGLALAIGLIILGIYLLVFDRTQKQLADQNLQVSTALKEARQKEAEKDEFSAFVKGFSPDEQKVLLAIKEQDGILQSTLRFRTGLSKSMLSLVLKSLEDRGFVSRKQKGKTNEVFLRRV